MSIKNQLSPEKWGLILQAPSAASFLVSMASGGFFEYIKESLSASTFMRDLALKEGGSGYGAIVDEMLADLKDNSFKETKESALHFESKETEGIRAELKQLLQEAAGILASLPGGQDYKRFLVDLARQSAETKTGGFLGIGAKSVIDEKEQAALDELAAMLGV